MEFIFHLIHPHSEGVPVCDQEPLPDVKFGVEEKQRSFYVLLNDPLALLLHHSAGDQLEDGFQMIHAHNTYTTGKAPS